MPEWLIVRQADLSCECLRCGERMRLELPVRCSVFIAAGRAFTKEHRGCRPRQIVPETPTEVIR